FYFPCFQRSPKLPIYARCTFSQCCFLTIQHKDNLFLYVAWLFFRGIFWFCHVHSCFLFLSFSLYLFLRLGDIFHNHQCLSKLPYLSPLIYVIFFFFFSYLCSFIFS